MLVLGLTGNIGCGKSSLSKIFREEFDIDIIDADIISRNIYKDKKILSKVFDEFGDSIKNNDGSLNRKELGNIVFNDDLKLIALNNILDKLLVVCCDEEIQIQRIIKRDSCSKNDAISRIKSQLSQKEKMSYADYIIDNSGTYEELKIKAYEFINYVKEKWCE